MNLYWLTYNTPRGTEVHVVGGTNLIVARVKAALAGQRGGYKKGHQLDARSAKNVPKNMIGRPLSREEAGRLLRRLA